jgi:hypothetical protein
MWRWCGGATWAGQASHSESEVANLLGENLDLFKKLALLMFWF